MNENRLVDFLDQMPEATKLACAYIEGMDKNGFFSDKRTQQAVILNIIVIGETATKLGTAYGST